MSNETKAREIAEITGISLETAERRLGMWEKHHEEILTRDMTSAINRRALQDSCHRLASYRLTIALRKAGL